MKRKPTGYFAMKHKVCIKCGENKYPHNAKGLCKRCYYQTDDQHKTQKIYREKSKHMAFVAYSGEHPCCVCCGLDDERFLSIDHINGCGTERRKKEPSGSPMYIFLKANKYPKGYQVLCHNCNMAKQHYGKCPHQSDK